MNVPPLFLYPTVKLALPELTAVVHTKLLIVSVVTELVVMVKE